MTYTYLINHHHKILTVLGYLIGAPLRAFDASPVDGVFRALLLATQNADMDIILLLRIVLDFRINFFSRYLSKQGKY